MMAAMRVACGILVAVVLGCGGTEKGTEHGGSDGPVEEPDASATVDGAVARLDAAAVDAHAPTPDLRAPNDPPPAEPDGPPVKAVPPVISQFQVPDTANRMCLTSTLPSAQRMTQGTLDLALDRVYPYILFPFITLEPGAPELLLSFVHVKVSGPAGVTVPWPAGCPAEFDVRFGALDFPGGSMASGGIEVLQTCHELALRELFAKGTLDARLQTQVMMTLTVNAKAYLGDQLVPSAPVDFPLRICVGCLQTGFAPPFDKYDYPKVPACAGLAGNPYLGNPCSPAQDFGPVLCCAKDASGTQLQCPAPP
jgi:hypothetical protein